MKKIFILLSVLFCIVFTFTGCVEKSAQYKSIKTKLDSLQQIQLNQHSEMETMLAGINEISAGMQSIREAEQLLTLQSTGDQENITTKGKIVALKNDIQAIAEAIEGYKEQIDKLENSNKRQSAEFKKMIAGLNQELEIRSAKIIELSNQLAAKEKEIGFKNQQIATLTDNIENLQEESTLQKERLAIQDKSINTAHYLLGNRKNLRDANVITRKGLFAPPIVSAQVHSADFVAIDIREITNIPLNSKKAKLLSTHPENSYLIETMNDGTKSLKILNVNSFWKQSKYLVVMINE